MIPKERVDAALQLAGRAYRKLDLWKSEIDPVAQDRLSKRASSYLRAAADVLDEGRSARQ